MRGRLGVRDALVHTHTRCISLIRALLRQHGYRVPSGSAERFVNRVRGLPLQGRVRSVVAPLLAVMRPLNRQLAYSDATIEHPAARDPRVPRLRSVPSIGPVPAAKVVDWLIRTGVGNATGIDDAVGFQQGCRGHRRVAGPGTRSIATSHEGRTVRTVARRCAFAWGLVNETNGSGT